MIFLFYWCCVVKLFFILFCYGMSGALTYCTLSSWHLLLWFVFCSSLHLVLFMWYLVLLIQNQYHVLMAAKLSVVTVACCFFAWTRFFLRYICSLHTCLVCCCVDWYCPILDPLHALSALFVICGSYVNTVGDLKNRSDLVLRPHELSD